MALVFPKFPKNGVFGAEIPISTIKIVVACEKTLILAYFGKIFQDGCPSQRSARMSTKGCSNWMGGRGGWGKQNFSLQKKFSPFMVPPILRPSPIGKNFGAKGAKNIFAAPSAPRIINGKSHTNIILNHKRGEILHIGGNSNFGFHNSNGMHRSWRV